MVVTCQPIIVCVKKDRKQMSMRNSESLSGSPEKSVSKEGDSKPQQVHSSTEDMGEIR